MVRGPRPPANEPRAARPGRHARPARCRWTLRTTSWTIASPRPLPPVSRSLASCSRSKRWNTRSASPGAMPGPSSLTTSSTAPSDVVRATSTCVEAWRTALSSRLRTTRLSRSGSPRTSPADTWRVRTGTRAVCRSWRTWAKTSSSRSTSSLRCGRLISSSRARASMSSTSRASRAVSSSMGCTRSARRAASPWRCATSSWACSAASGLRSSCAASATKRCCADDACSSRASSAFMVSASARHLVAGGRDVYPAVQIAGRDALDLAAQPLDGAQRIAHQDGDDGPEHGQQDRHADGERERQAGREFLHLAQRCRDDDGVGVSGHHQQSLLVDVDDAATNAADISQRPLAGQLGSARHYHAGPVDHLRLRQVPRLWGARSARRPQRRADSGRRPAAAPQRRSTAPARPAG